MPNLPLAGLCLALVGALPLAAASCGVFPGVAGIGRDVAPDSLALRTDSLLVSVDSLRYTVAVGFPQFTGASATVSAARVAAVNAALRDSVVALAETFRPAEAVAPEDRASFSTVSDVQGGPEDVFLGGDVLSAAVWVHAYTGGAHGNTFVQPLTVDLRTGAPVRLGDVFAAGTPWADTLSAHAGRGLVAKAMGPGGAATPDEARGWLYAEGYDAAAMQTAAFTLGADSLAVHFVPYEVSSYAFGSTRVPVAYADLGTLLRPGGPVARIRAAR